MVSASLTSTWLPKVTHDPNDKALTFSPDFPKRRYSTQLPLFPYEGRMPDNAIRRNGTVRLRVRRLTETRAVSVQQIPQEPGRIKSKILGGSGLVRVFAAVHAVAQESAKTTRVVHFVEKDFFLGWIDMVMSKGKVNNVNLQRCQVVYLTEF